MTTEDPIVAEVRAAREAILARFNYDWVAYMEDVMRRQEELKRQGHVFVAPPPPPAEPAADRGAA